MYFGGQAFVLILNSIFPSFLHMKNTLPESAGITTPGLIGFVLFILLYFPIIYFVPAWKVQKLLEVQIIVATVTLLGIMGWAVSVGFLKTFHKIGSDIKTGKRRQPRKPRRTRN
jgi:NCS1 family nucleobase:cation symporter-1